MASTNSPEPDTVDSDDEADSFFIRMIAQQMQLINIAVQVLLSTINKKVLRIRNNRPFSGREMVMDILGGHPDRCHDTFRMSSANFMLLCEEVVQEGIINTDEVTVEEQVGMFLQILAQSHTQRKIEEDYQRSLETISRCFKNVLRSVLRLRSKYIVLPDGNAPIPAKVAEGSEFAPFKNALGAIDGTYVPCYPPTDIHKRAKERWRCRKQFYAQNVLAVVDFDGYFVYVLTGWEGAAHDNLVLRGALSRFHFKVPENRYYLADSGYANTSNFITPYRNHPYWLGAFRNRSSANRYQCPEDFYNHQHARLRNVVERTFGVLKERFKILEFRRPYKYENQSYIVIACCILHNFIKRHTAPEPEQEEVVGPEPEEPDPVTAAYIDSDATTLGGIMRQHIRDQLWAAHTS